MVKEKLTTTCIAVCKVDPQSNLAEVYYDMYATEMDPKLRQMLENQDNVQSMRPAIANTWERKKI